MHTHTVSDLNTQKDVPKEAAVVRLRTGEVNTLLLCDISNALRTKTGRKLAMVAISAIMPNIRTFIENSILGAMMVAYTDKFQIQNFEKNKKVPRWMYHAEANEAIQRIADGIFMTPQPKV